MNTRAEPETVAAIDGCDELFDLPASARPQLSDPATVARIAKLKLIDPRRFEELIANLRANKVPRLPELEKDVGKVIRDAEKHKAARASAPDTAEDGFERSPRGEIQPSQHNIRLAVANLGVTLRYNAFAGVPTIDGLSGYGPAIDDNAMNRLWLLIDERFGFRPPLPFFQVVVADACQQNPFHPVLDYLDSVSWDGIPRLDRWLLDYCGVEDTPFARAVGAMMLVAAVRRVRAPGTKHDEMLVLESPEGFSKSSLLEALAVNEDWFSDSLPLNVDDKKMIEAASGKWIIEVSELQGMRKGDVGKIKAQLSRKRDRARLAYGRLPVEVARQCVFFGTVNPMEAEGYLASITGNRRFWPVEVTAIDLDAFIRDRDQLWAEASLREAEGASTRLDPSLWPDAAEQQAAREAPNPYREALVPHLASQEGILFAEDVWGLLNIPVDRRQALYGKVGKALNDLGWKRVKRRRRRGADQQWAYVRGNEKCRLVPTNTYGVITIERVAAGREKVPEATSEETESTDLSHIELVEISDDDLGI